jgi:phage terminase small subunit
VVEGLTKKQTLFIHHYIANGFNGTHAARSAGYNSTSDNVLAVIASVLLKHVKVKGEIDKVMSEKLDELGITEEKILAELGKIAFLSSDEFAREDGTLKTLDEVSENAKHAIVSVERYIDRHGVERRKAKLADKIKALELLGKSKKLFTDRVEHGGDMTLSSFVQELDKNGLPEDETEEDDGGMFE